MQGVVWMSLILIVAAIVGFIAVIQVKRWVNKPDQSPATGFTLSDLRSLHRSGKMTDEEFEKAKALIVAAAQKAAQREAQEKEKAATEGRIPR